MKILILGSEGFIGGQCIDYFGTGGHEVTGVDLFEQPTRRYSYYKVSRLSFELQEIFARTQFDAVINASGSGNVPYSMTHPLIDFEANSLDTIRVLDAIRRHQSRCRYIHISSAAVYGNPASLPIQESAATHPLSPYGWHKLIAEQICQEYSAIYNLALAIVRPFSVYGPGLRKQLFWDVYQKTKVSDQIELFGTGKESRDFIYVKDLVRAMALILEKGEMRGEIYNAGAGLETTIEDAIGIFLTQIGYPGTYRFNRTVREGDPLNWRADVSKLLTLGFKTEVSLTGGLDHVSSWIKKDEKN